MAGGAKRDPYWTDGNQVVVMPPGDKAYRKRLQRRGFAPWDPETLPEGIRESAKEVLADAKPGTYDIRPTGVGGFLHGPVAPVAPGRKR